MSFFSRSFERHFNERRNLNTPATLYLTKTTKGRNADAENFSTTVPGTYLIPEELDREHEPNVIEAWNIRAHHERQRLVRLRRLSNR